MNEEAQRIAIAEACGWKECRPRASQFSVPWISGINPRPDEIVGIIDARTGDERAPTDEDYGRPETLPDYLNDLNAMHEAEKTLDPHVRNDFIAHLWSVTGNEPSANFWTEYNFRGLYACTHATAAQRAEAFLRTVGKWEDGK